MIGKKHTDMIPGLMRENSAFVLSEMSTGESPALRQKYLDNFVIKNMPPSTIALIHLFVHTSA